MLCVCCCRMSSRQVCEVVGTGVGRDRGHAPVLGGGETCSNHPNRSQALSAPHAALTVLTLTPCTFSTCTRGRLSSTPVL